MSLLGTASVASAKSLLVNTNKNRFTGFVVYVNRNRVTGCIAHWGFGWQDTKINVNPGDVVMIIKYKNGCSGSASHREKRVPRDKLKYFWFNI